MHILHSDISDLFQTRKSSCVKMQEVYCLQHNLSRDGHTPDLSGGPLSCPGVLLSCMGGTPTLSGGYPCPGVPFPRRNLGVSLSCSGGIPILCWGYPYPVLGYPYPLVPSPTPARDLGPETGVPFPPEGTWDQRLWYPLSRWTNKLKALPSFVLRTRR